ncbi:hypothetical protein CLV59_106214 [Chitinophaga dinghuensis]|uniref:Uncharacterized protein n=2 Tax=Chitinophaga dinghuensis TaxID=1539050 RepID=A0A327VV58_9BACT|nr:hypothetical protein CLV59_106214 [Chitinophaga dinghuensis]
MSVGPAPLPMLTFSPIKCMKKLYTIPLCLLLACNTSSKVYTAPAMGAESKFDDGLRPEKHPQYLFDKKTMKDMKRTGLSSDYTRKRNTAPTAPVKKSAPAADSLAQSSDSSHAAPPNATHTPVSDSIPTRKDSIQ